MALTQSQKAILRLLYLKGPAYIWTGSRYPKAGYTTSGEPVLQVFSQLALDRIVEPLTKTTNPNNAKYQPRLSNPDVARYIKRLGGSS